LLSVLQIIAWGVDFFTICALIISVLVVLSNFHALFRYSQRLYIDHYSVLMKVWAAFTIVLAFVALSGLIVFSRVNLNTKKTNVVETKYRLDGSFKSGFYKTSLFSIPNAQITEFSENPTQTHKKVVVVIPDKRCDTENLKPYLFMLARAGFTVYSGDFYTNDCKWLDSVWNSKYFRRFARRNSSFASYANNKQITELGNNLSCNGRYSALNFENRHTVEFRIFRGNLKYESIMALFELVQGVCDFVKLPHVSLDLIYNQQEICKQVLKRYLEECNFVFLPSYTEMCRVWRD
jgi:hypothetical protein